MSITECKVGDIVYYSMGEKRVYDVIKSIEYDTYLHTTHICLALNHYVSSIEYKKFEYDKGDYIVIGGQGLKIDRFVIETDRKIYSITEDGIRIPIELPYAYYTLEEFNHIVNPALKLAVNSVYGTSWFKQPKLSMINLAKVIYKLKNKELEKAFETVCKDTGITTSTKQETKLCKYINDICVYEEIK